MHACRVWRAMANGLTVVALFSLYPSAAGAGAIFFGPSPYLAFDNTLPGAGTAISAFSGLGFSYFYLETFEDGLLNTPGVTGTGGAVAGPGGITDSVDADDGVIDGLGRDGHSYFGSGSVGVRFDFSSAALGSLPTHAG